MQNRILRIGTRDSELALWQARLVQDLLSNSGVASELVPVKSKGDLDLVTPLYAMGVEGVFTKTLDAYLLSNRIDVIVHSMKDVPTQLAQGIVQAAVLERGTSHDIFIPNKKKVFNSRPVIASGSVRRKAQWLHKYPETQFENLRGNVQTRLKKLEESDWNGIIMAQAGLQRVHLLPDHYEVLDWMLPAPAQGAILVVCRSEDEDTFQKVSPLNNQEAELCTKIERDFLRTLMGGCSTPISAHAQIVHGKISFSGNILSPDGKQKMETKKDAEFADANKLGVLSAKELLEKGADKIVEIIRQK